MSPRQIMEQAADRRAKEREADRRLEYGISPDTITIAAARGEPITEFPARPGEREKPPKRLSGLDWLWLKGRITVAQMGAGLKYGDDYRLSTDLSIRSGSNFDRSGGDGTTSQEIRMEAQRRLAAVQRHGLNGHVDLIDLCNRVAGEGKRLRDLVNGDDQEATKKEAVFKVALDMLVRHFGMESAR